MTVDLVEASSLLSLPELDEEAMYFERKVQYE
jgi:hypothetical protein